MPRMRHHRERAGSPSGRRRFRTRRRQRRLARQPDRRRPRKNRRRGGRQRSRKKTSARGVTMKSPSASTTATFVSFRKLNRRGCNAATEYAWPTANSCRTCRGRPRQRPPARWRGPAERRQKADSARKPGAGVEARHWLSGKIGEPPEQKSYTLAQYPLPRGNWTSFPTRTAAAPAQPDR